MMTQHTILTAIISGLIAIGIVWFVLDSQYDEVPGVVLGIPLILLVIAFGLVYLYRRRA